MPPKLRQFAWSFAAFAGIVAFLWLCIALYVGAFRNHERDGRAAVRPAVEQLVALHTRQVLRADYQSPLQRAANARGLELRPLIHEIGKTAKRADGNRINLFHAYHYNRVKYQAERLSADLARIRRELERGSK